MLRALFATALGVGALSLVPSAASAAEHITDGGFEASTCDAAECTNPAWDDSSTSAFANGTGPICRAGTGAGNTACTGGGSAPFTGSTWARLGAGHKPVANDGGIVSEVEQTVLIPSAPATLSFRLRIIDAAGPTGTFTVELDDTQIFAVTDATPGFAAYAQVTIDMSSRAGTRTLIEFTGASTQAAIGALDSFDIDDVSVTTVDPEDPRCAKLRAKLRKAKGKTGKKAKKKRRKLRKKLKKLGC